jgi:hypothetical protein
VGAKEPIPIALLRVANKVVPFKKRGTGWATIRVFAILTKWFSLTRLETRTKESNIYASIWVENPDA